MTRQEALREVEFLVSCSYVDEFEPTEREALKMLIKEYKQGHILDKIRDEIKSKIVKRPWLDFEDRERDRNDAFLEVLDIIDRYREE